MKEKESRREGEYVEKRYMLRRERKRERERESENQRAREKLTENKRESK